MAEEQRSRGSAPDSIPEPGNAREPGPQGARDSERLDRGVESERPERKVGDKIDGEANMSEPRPGEAVREETLRSEAEGRRASRSSSEEAPEERSGLLGRARDLWERIRRRG